MNNTPEDVKKALEDLQFIKSAIEGNDRRFPGKPWMFFVGSLSVGVATIISYVVPELKASFDRSFLMVWLPLFVLTFATITAGFLVLEKKQELVLTRPARDIAFVRFGIGPALFVFLFVCWHAGMFMPPLLLVGLTIASTLGTMILPVAIRAFPFVYLGTGITELAAGWNQPEIGFLDGLLVAAGLLVVGLILKTQGKLQIAAESGSSDKEVGGV